MRTAVVFLAGLLIGSTIATGVAQSSRIPGVNNMNHVAVAVENFDDAFSGTASRQRYLSPGGSRD